MLKPLVIIGSGGHASVLLDILLQQNRNLVGVVSNNAPSDSAIFKNIPYFSKDEEVLDFHKENVKLVNGIGSIPGSKTRRKIYEFFTGHGYQFETVISDKSHISDYAVLDDGVQVMPGAIVQAHAKISSNSIINSGAIIEHDCIVGKHNHIAPGVTLSGQVCSAENVHFGTGAKIIQSITIGANAVIGAGAIVTKDVESNCICYPARSIIEGLKLK